MLHGSIELTWEGGGWATWKHRKCLANFSTTGGVGLNSPVPLTPLPVMCSALFVKGTLTFSICKIFESKGNKWWSVINKCLDGWMDHTSPTPLLPGRYYHLQIQCIINTLQSYWLLLFCQGLPKVFSAGLDLIKELHNPDPKRLGVFWHGFQEMWLRLYGSRLATIAVVKVIR